MEDAESKLLVTGAGGNEAAESVGVVPCMSVEVDVGVGGEAELKVCGKGGFLSPVLEGAGEAGPLPLSEQPKATDVALFLHTSGTTSRPKGVPLTHGNLIASLMNIKETYEFSEKDVSLLVMPLFHVHGLMAGAFFSRSVSFKGDRSMCL